MSLEMAALDPAALEERVARFVRARGLLPHGSTLVVAVSGGQDSVCMLDILVRLRDELGLRLHVAHLNHMFRGAQSEREAEYVRELAREQGLPATVAAVDVPAYRTRHRLAKQVAARYARLQFLAGVAAQVGAGRIAIGHTADDVVETLLLNLLRGAGLDGLRGIPPCHRLGAGQLGPPLRGDDWRAGRVPLPTGDLPLLVRPILGLFRDETEGYCRARGLAFRRDPSNLDMAFRRNWVRLKLLPLMESRVPGARERVWNAADLLSDEYSLVTRVVDDAWSDLAMERPGLVEFALEGWGRLDVALRRHLLRRAVERLLGSLEGFGRLHVDACEDAIRRGPVGVHIDLPRGLWLEKGYNSFWVAGPATPPPPDWAAPCEPVPLPIPGEVALPGGVLVAERVEVEAGHGGWGGAETRWEAWLDAARVGPSLWVRRRRPGDSFVPLGMSQTKKLQDFLVDAKIPRAERDRIPLVATPDRIVWVVGYRIDDRFKVTAETREVLKLRFRRTGEEL